MPSISGPSITSSGRFAFGRASSVSSVMKSVMPCTSACDSRLPTGQLAPGEIGLGLLAGLAEEALGDVEQPLGRIVAPVEHHVLAGLAQFRIEIVIDRHLRGIDDAHIHAGLDGVIQEHRMHRLAHRLVAAERE